MNEEMRALVKALREMGSEKAADHLLERFPAGSHGSGVATTAIGHLSWRRADQMRLAKHYLSNLPHASGRAYRVFAAIMSIPRLLRIIEDNMPEDEDRKDLLFYYLRPVFREGARTEADRETVADFMGRYS